MGHQLQAVEDPATSSADEGAALDSTPDRSPRSSVATLRRRLLASVSPADVAAVTGEVLRMALDRSGVTRDQLAACRLLLEYAVGKPGAVEGEQAGAGPRFVFQFAGPVSVGVESEQLPPPRAVGLLPAVDAADG